MATGVSQKGCTNLFPLSSFRKNDISKMKHTHTHTHTHKEEMQKALKGILIFKQRKNKNKKYTYPDDAQTLTFSLQA